MPSFAADGMRQEALIKPPYRRQEGLPPSGDNYNVDRFSLLRSFSVGRAAGQTLKSLPQANFIMGDNLVLRIQVVPFYLLVIGTKSWYVDKEGETSDLVVFSNQVYIEILSTQVQVCKDKP